MSYKISHVLVGCFAVDVIWEEEKFEYEEDNRKFDKDDGPEGFA